MSAFPLLLEHERTFLRATIYLMLRLAPDKTSASRGGANG
jgi:hypothetical protein